jgi:uncharacterized membrane protein YgdD (TMEM256/DUF423 family)
MKNEAWARAIENPLCKGTKSLMRIFLMLAGLLGGLGVAAGAFGAHALRARLEPRMLEIFETGARYQMYHALALLAVAWLIERGVARAAAAGWCFVAGTVIFSGTLYLLTLTGARWWGAITPIGGVLLIVGWLLLALAGWRLK